MQETMTVEDAEMVEQAAQAMLDIGFDSVNYLWLRDNILVRVIELEREEVPDEGVY